MIGIRKRGDSYQVNVAYQGQRRYGSAPTLEEAKVLRAKLLGDLVAGRKEVKAWTLKRAFDHTLDHVWADTKGERTVTLNARAAVEFFGEDTPLSDIDTIDLDRWVHYLGKMGNSNATINRKLSALSRMMTTAADRGGLDRKPKFPKRKEPVGRVRYLTEEEEALVFATVEAWGSTDLSDALVVLLDTGMRLGELLRITWEDIVDTPQGRKAVTLWVTKADHPRTVPLTERAWLVIQNRRKWGRKPLFEMTARTLQSQWDRVRYHLEMEDVTLHTMRHTCASRLVQRGVSIPVVQQWLGHKTISVTMRYAHLSPTNLHEAASVLESATA